MTHYYDTAGHPAYEIIGKNGKSRVPYKKEAKALGLAPGTTSINGQLDKPALTNWVVDKTIDICMRNPFCEMGMGQQEWRDSIKRKLAIDKERITSQGQHIHKALEKYYQTGKISDKYREFIVPVIELIADNWPNLQRSDWIAEASFNYKGFYGGCVDLHHPGDRPIILDFKTKDSDDISKFKAYDEHKQQLCAYAHGLKIINAECGNIFLSALKPNIIALQMHEDVQEYWDKYKILLQYWHLEHYKQKINID